LSAFVPNADSIGIGGEAQGYASIGVYGNTKGQGSISVFGLANGIGATGVSGVENGTDIGEGPQNIGVSGTASVGIGVMGTSIGASSTSSTLETYRPQAGVWGDTRGGSLVNFSPAVLGTADDTYAGYFKNNSYDAPTINVINTGTGINGAAIFQSAATGSPAIVVDNTGGDAAATLINDSNTSPTLFLSNYGTGGVTNFAAKKMGPANDALFKTFMASTPTGTCGIGGNGDLSCTGQMKSLVSAGDGSRKVETYAMQSPENWMEDFGTATLENGVAVVRIDPAFAETVSGSNDYHVFLTPRGDSNGLYVINATPASFEVRESKGGTSSLSFDYRIVAKRRGYEVQRLRDVTESFNEAKALVKRPDSPRTPTLLPTPVLQMKPGIAPAHPPGIPKAIQAELEASEHQAYPAHPATPKGIQLKETPTSSTHP